jgi:CBS domain-containing protein
VIALCQRALEAETGTAPAPFAWIALGSEGRAEQTLSTDQDNALVFADVPPGEVAAVQAWFLRMAARAVEGLEACGFPRCKGNVMASNPELCLPLGAWQRKFAGYLDAADPEALLRASIYFDFRCLYGEAALVEALWGDLLARMRTQRGFLRHLAAHGLEGRPPIGTLGWRLRSLLHLRHPPLDVKTQALAPLVAAVRVLALAAGSAETNTLARLYAARTAEVLPPELARAAHRAYDFLMLLRIRQHFAQETRGEPPTNALRLERLDPLQRRFLIEALRTVLELQDHVVDQYGGIPLT